jgi:hypothetical protein
MKHAVEWCLVHLGKNVCSSNSRYIQSEFTHLRCVPAFSKTVKFADSIFLSIVPGEGAVDKGSHKLDEFL